MSSTDRPEQHHRHGVGDRAGPSRRRRSRGRAGRAGARSRRLSALPQGPRDVAAVQRQQRDEVEDEEHEVQRREQADEEPHLVAHGLADERVVLAARSPPRRPGRRRRRTSGCRGRAPDRRRRPARHRPSAAGIWTMASAVRLTSSQTMPGTAVTGCWTYSTGADVRTPRKPASRVCSVPSALVTGMPSASSTGTTLRIGVAVTVSCSPSRTTTIVDALVDARPDRAC